MTDHLAVISEYYDACNTGDVASYERTLHPDVVHYFLKPNTGSRPVAGRDRLIAYWTKVQSMIDGVWVVDRLLSSGDEAVIEWTLFWNPTPEGQRVVTRGSEWFAFDSGQIIEIRSFYQQRNEDTELDAYPYLYRGYSAHGSESSAIHTTTKAAT